LPRWSAPLARVWASSWTNSASWVSSITTETCRSITRSWM